MPKLHSSCLGRRRRSDRDSDDQYYFTGSKEDESTLVSRDEQESGNGCFRPFISQSNNRSSTEGANETTDLCDKKKRRKEKRKIARKELRKRIGHIMHSSWKWFKRGAVAISPAMTSMLVFAPSPGNIIMATRAAKHDGSNRSVFL